MDSIKSLLFKKGPDCLDSGGFGSHVGQSNTELQRQVSSPDPESDMIAAVSKLIARDTVFYIFTCKSNFNAKLALLFKQFEGEGERKK